MKSKTSNTLYKVISLLLVAMFTLTIFASDYNYASAASSDEEITEETVEEATTEKIIKETTTKKVTTTTEKDEDVYIEETLENDEVAYDDNADSQEAELSLEEQRSILEANIKKTDEKLAVLAKKSKVTEEYINTLDEKIGELNEQLTVLENQIVEYTEEQDQIQEKIDKNAKKAKKLKKEIAKYEKQLKELKELFTAKYEAYCERMRAIYISGNWSIITALLTSSDISSFLTRYEMIKAVSKSDGELLADIERQADDIEAEGSALNKKKEKLEVVQSELEEEQANLLSKQSAVEEAQESLAVNKATLSADRAESDNLYAQLTAENGMYSEYKNEDSELAASVEKEISDLINGLISADDVTLATTGDRSSSKSEKYTYTDVYNKSNAILNMTYPVPGHYTVSCSFGKYSNGGNHTGTDFPCPKGSKVVAAQSGVVIKVKRLDYSYGYYVMVYHGTDAKGRSVVTLYAHNSSILVTTGQTVSKGETIALSGSTGNSTGPHCHFEIRFNGTAVNPIYYLNK